MRADARQAELPMPLPPPKPISPPTAGSLAGATNTDDVHAQITVGKNDADASFNMRWPGASPGTKGSELKSMSDSAKVSYAEEERMTNSPDDITLIWPVLTTDLRAAGPQLAAAVQPQGILAVLASTFAFGTMMFRLTYKRSAAWPVGRSSFFDQRRSVANARHPRERVLPDLAHRPADASLADFNHNSNGAIHRTDIASARRRQGSAGSAHAIEERVIHRRVARIPSPM